MPAQMLERSTPAARFKGRMQEGADADVVIFNPETVSDRSTYQHPMEPSVGVEYLLVGGVVVVDQGQLMDGVFPGQALRSSRGPRTKTWSHGRS
jgi:N-acyl-D-glutamate deacylase